MSKNFNLEDGEQNDSFVHFEKFTKKIKDKKDKKKSLRDFRGGKDKRKFPEREPKRKEGK